MIGFCIHVGVSVPGIITGCPAVLDQERASGDSGTTRRHRLVSYHDDCYDVLLWWLSSSLHWGCVGCWNRRNPQMRNVTDRLAFITDQVVLLPDVFRGEPYDESIHPDYEKWRAKVGGLVVAGDYY